MFLTKHVSANMQFFEFAVIQAVEKYYIVA